MQKDFGKKLVNGLKNDPKAFWRYANSKLKSKDKISQLKKANGTSTDNDKEKADELNTFFSSVFTEEDLEHIPTLDKRYKNDPLKIFKLMKTLF